MSAPLPAEGRGAAAAGDGRRPAGEGITDQMTLDAALATVARASPDRPALALPGRQVTYRDLDLEVTRLAATLRGKGLSRGDMVALLVPNGWEAVRGFFAIVRAGAVAVPLSPALKAAELARVLAGTPPALVLAARRVPGNDLGRALATARQALPSAPEVLFTDGGAPGELGGTGSGPGAGGHADAGVAAGPDDLAAVFFTTGTTGAPRGVMHSHRGLLASFLAMERLYAGFFSGSPAAAVARTATLLWRYRGRLLRGIGPQTWMTPMPAHTIAGFRVVLQTLLGGHRLVLPERFHPRGALELIERERVSILAATPTMVQAMLEVGDLGRYDLSSLLVVGLGAAPAAPDLARRARAALGCAVVIGYGSTETAGGVLVTRLEDREDRMAETVGRPFPGAEVRVVDDRRREVPPGTVGELACRVAGLMLGYRGERAGAAAVVDEQGWYYTGDLATIDRGGYVRIVGRKRDLIIRGGQNVIPAELERVLLDHPAVERCVVVGVPDPLAGEKIWAFVVPREGAGLVTADLLTHCAQRLEPHKLPDHFRVRDQLPLAESGEIRRADLRAAAMAETRRPDTPATDTQGDSQHA